jgi:hypothetical protein
MCLLLPAGRQGSRPVPISERWDEPGCVAFTCLDPDSWQVEVCWERITILVLDEAHLLDADQLEELRLLTNSEMDSHSPFA